MRCGAVCVCSFVYMYFCVYYNFALLLVWLYCTFLLHILYIRVYARKLSEWVSWAYWIFWLGVKNIESSWFTHTTLPKCTNKIHKNGRVCCSVWWLKIRTLSFLVYIFYKYSLFRSRSRCRLSRLSASVFISTAFTSWFNSISFTTRWARILH